MVLIALPALCEKHLADWVQDLCLQTVLPKEVFICINQAAFFLDSQEEENRQVVETNRQSLQELARLQQEKTLPFALSVIDRSSPGFAFDTAHSGVGWARKTAMDAACEKANPADLLLSMDADTKYPRTYIAHMLSLQAQNPEAVAFAGAYFHLIPPSISLKQAVAALHYEVYMRAYAIQMLLSHHPYAFTAIGSSLGCPVGAYRKIGGMPPHSSGEDFYFLQKLSKYGPVCNKATVGALPSVRVSGRVIFGTGPAIAMGLQNQWASCPIYPMRLFEQMQYFYDSIEDFYGQPKLDLGPFGSFASNKWGPSWHNALRKNHKTPAAFKKACLHKIDALRSLQFLKSQYTYHPERDAENLRELFQRLQKEMKDVCFWALGEGKKSLDVWNLDAWTLEDWRKIRSNLYRCERRLKQRTTQENTPVYAA